MAEVQRDGSLPKEIAAHPELVEMYAPILRADAALTEDYEPIAPPALQCPLVLWSAEEDIIVPAEMVEDWQRYGEVEAKKCFSGGHDYILADSARVLDALKSLT